MSRWCALSVMVIASPTSVARWEKPLNVRWNSSCILWTSSQKASSSRDGFESRFVILRGFANTTLPSIIFCQIFKYGNGYFTFTTEVFLYSSIQCYRSPLDTFRHRCTIVSELCCPSGFFELVNISGVVQSAWHQTDWKNNSDLSLYVLQIVLIASHIS